jgi:hypothetical protein
MIFIPRRLAKIAPFRPVPDGFRRVSIEILYSIALGRAAKGVSGFGFPGLPSPCYPLVQGDRSLLSRSTIA